MFMRPYCARGRILVNIMHHVDLTAEDDVVGFVDPVLTLIGYQTTTDSSTWRLLGRIYPLHRQDKFIREANVRKMAADPSDAEVAFKLYLTSIWSTSPQAS